MTSLELLAFARGPALWFSLGVLVAGSLWRTVAILRLGTKADLSVPRSNRTLRGAMRNIAARMLPHPEFRRSTGVPAWNAYVYHLGLALIVFAYAPHVDFVERLVGLRWPALPDPVVFLCMGLTFVSLFAALVVRLNDPVRRLLSGFDDYFSWCIVLLPLLTGMAAIDQGVAHDRASAVPLYPLPVALHLLSVELLFVWLPFGKLAHAFLVFASRGVTGAALARKGAAL